MSERRRYPNPDDWPDHGWWPLITRRSLVHVAWMLGAFVLGPPTILAALFTWWEPMWSGGQLRAALVLAVCANAGTACLVRALRQLQ